MRATSGKRAAGRNVLTAAFAALLACLVCLGNARAQDADGTAVLLELVPRGSDAVRRLTRADLDALPQVTFDTATNWTEGVHRFSGPSLHDVLRLAGLDGQPVEAVAENAYRVVILPEWVTQDAPIIATRIDGRPFGRRELGPLWVVFPYDHDQRYRSEAAYSQSIWQLVRLQARQD